MYIVKYFNNKGVMVHQVFATYEDAETYANTVTIEKQNASKVTIESTDEGGNHET